MSSFPPPPDATDAGPEEDGGSYASRKAAERDATIALMACRDFVAGAAEMTSYGFFPGGNFDPRSFVPDDENDEGEIAAHKAACEAWERGERPDIKRSGRVEIVTLPALPERPGPEGITLPATPERTGPAIVCGGIFGPGIITYRDPEAAALLAQIDRALNNLPTIAIPPAPGAASFDAAVAAAQTNETE